MTDQHDVTAMFDDIAPRYDFLNHFLSLNIDKIWRRKTSKILAKQHPTTILDVATGTADLALQIAKDNPTAHITGIDLSEKMIHLGMEKVNKLQLGQRIQLLLANAEALPFPDQHFDAVSCAFGVRNFENLSAGLKEMRRVTKEGGIIALLEFSKPSSPLVKGPYRFYSKHFLPLAGRIISGHPNAYNYLPSSIETFAESNLLAQELTASGLTILHVNSLCGGIANIYECIKKTEPHHNNKTEMAVN